MQGRMPMIALVVALSGALFGAGGAAWAQDTGTTTRQTTTTTITRSFQKPSGALGEDAIKGDVAQAVAKLKQQPGQDILMYGCGELARTLMQHDLIDEYRFWVYPVVVEEGTRLFGGAGKATLKLVDTKPFSAGFAILTCRPAQRVSQ